MPSSTSTTFTFPLAFLLLLSLSALSSAQSTTPPTTLTPTGSPPASSTSVVPTIVSTVNQYQYIGCYNETTGDAAAGNVRALAGGNMTASPTLTPQICASFCAPQTYAGLEYADECWCAYYLNANSAKLADEECALPCAGDAADVCGGSLRLSVYMFNGTLEGGSGGSGGSTSAGMRSTSEFGFWVWGAIGIVGVTGFVGLRG
ncbi:MAG: hypothetical protein MMC33_006059 [Icmadophila ericetorum]|nr:hypothetical protein [Icmadophila ericetorum]